MTKQILESTKQEHFRIAVLDDYQDVALSLADWSEGGKRGLAKGVSQQILTDLW